MRYAPSMPTDEFKRWADAFDRRRRFGLPALPINRKVATMPPSVVSLPPRQGSMKFSEDDVSAVITLLSECERGQAVQLTDTADPKENTARRRAQIMKDQIESRDDGAHIPAGFKLRGHVLTAGDPTVQKIAGKNYKLYPENWPAVSLVPDDDYTAPDEPSGDDEPSPDEPSGGAPTPDPAPDEPNPSGRRGRR